MKLVENNFTVVSGLARGIDTKAQSEGLAQGQLIEKAVQEYKPGKK